MKYKNIFLCSLAAIALTGCGGVSTGSQTELGNSDAVSAGAVSGTALKQEKDDVKQTTKGFTMKSSNSNRTNLYKQTGEEYSNVIVQCRLDGTKIRNFEVERKGADIVSVRYVDDEWLYYTRWEKKTPANVKLWRAPIQKKDGCDDILFESEEFLFLSENGIFDNIYVLGDYVYYNESGGGAKASTYCKYDMKKKEWMTFAEGSPQQSQGNGSRWLGAVGENMLLYCDEEMTTKENAGIYVQPLSSNAFYKIQELGGDDEAFYTVLDYVCSQEAFFFQCETDWDIQEDDKTAVKVWKPGMEKALTFLADKDIKKILDKSEFRVAGKKVTLEDIKYCEWKIWLDESYLYVHLSEIDEEDSGEEVWLACDGIDKYSLKILDQAPETFIKEDE
ncbi:MAG: hypothetical protein NC293_10485 [Roseburia sp.]|nr:hypothetical protein [Roseburia sp.]